MVCEEVLIPQKVIEKLPHTPETEEAVPATCTDYGILDLGRLRKHILLALAEVWLALVGDYIGAGSTLSLLDNRVCINKLQ